MFLQNSEAPEDCGDREAGGGQEVRHCEQRPPPPRRGRIRGRIQQRMVQEVKIYVTDNLSYSVQ